MNGIDLLGLSMQDVEMLARAWPKGWALGSLLGTFSRGDIGADLAAIERIISTGRCPVVRVHLVNWTCWRNRNAEPWEPKPGTHVKVVQQRAALVLALAKRYPKVKFYVSPLLEYDEKDRAKVAALVSAARRGAPGLSVVLSPTAHAATLPAVIIERHGNDAKGDIVSNDGAIFWEIGPAWKGRGKIVTFCWWPECNLRLFDEKKFVPPSKRPATNRVTQDQIESCVLTLTARNP